MRTTALLAIIGLLIFIDPSAALAVLVVFVVMGLLERLLL